VQKLDHYLGNSRVFAQDFAAKLPTVPQFTVYASNLKDLTKGFDKLSPNWQGV
jgi:hypothetical protein